MNITWNIAISGRTPPKWMGGAVAQVLVPVPRNMSNMTEVDLHSNQAVYAFISENQNTQMQFDSSDLFSGCSCRWDCRTQLRRQRTPEDSVSHISDLVRPPLSDIYRPTNGPWPLSERYSLFLTKLLTPIIGSRDPPLRESA